MKPTNPIAQLEQWKKNNKQGKINQFVNEMNQTKIGLVKGNKLKIEPVKFFIASFKNLTQITQYIFMLFPKNFSNYF